MAPRKRQTAPVPKTHGKKNAYRITKAKPQVKNNSPYLIGNDNGLLKVMPKGKFQKLAERNSEASPLLRLPVEIRLRIFGYVLGGNEYSVYKPKKKPVCAVEGQPRGEAHRNLQVQRVCTQIYSETATLPFTLNTFYAWPHMIYGWQKTLIPGHRNALQTMRVNFPEASENIMDLHYFKGLQRVVVCYTPDSRKDLGRVAERLHLLAEKQELDVEFRRFD